jgi:predicted nicotinamide N-methyase
MKMISLIFIGTSLSLLSLLRTKRKVIKVQNDKNKVFVETIRTTLSTSVVRVGHAEISFELTLPPDAIEPLFSGAAWAGTVIWQASLFLANYLQSERRCHGRLVLELGAGVGVPGIVAGMLGAKRVILTEQPPLDELLGRNIAKIFRDDEKLMSRYSIMTLDWREPIPPEVASLDLILISDCIYEGLYGDVWKDLAKVLNALLTDKNRALNCVERRKGDGIDSFVKYCEEMFLIRSSLVSRRVSPEKVIELYEMRKLEHVAAM